MSVGKRIREIRGILSRKAFADRIKIVENTLRNYEDDLSLPNIDVSSRICREFSVSLLWLAEGIGPMRPGEEAQPLPEPDPHAAAPLISGDFVMIPMVEAVLSAGGGSFETSANSERAYAFRKDFISRKGNINNMILMRVSGDSMEPDVLDGDVVLIDQSKIQIAPGKIYAVGFEEAIYLKRIDIAPGKAILKSTNPAYPPMELDIRGQISEHFRVIGRVLWSGREYK